MSEYDQEKMAKALTYLAGPRAAKRAEARRKKAHAIAEKLDKLAKQSDDLELTLPNGGIVGNMLAGIAEDLRLI